MKANELMIGDWVRIKDLKDPIKRISCIDEYLGVVDFWDGEKCIVTSINNVLPIHITGKILENNGFYASEVSPHHIKYVCSTGPIDEFADIVLICGKDNKDKWRWDCLDLRIHYYRGDIHQFKINYVHELQHAMRLCSIEKEIEL